MKLGYIGLGLMGKSMARNLLKAGYEVTVHNRSRGAVAELVAEGAKEAFSPKEVAANADVIFLNLPDGPDVELVIFGENGIIENAHEGLLIVDNSTIAPTTTRALHARLTDHGMALIDAPVSGGDVGAAAGTLTIMVGATEEQFATVLPMFEAMGKSITLVGEAGAGQIAKVANQMMVAAQMTAMGELMILAQKAGADVGKVVQAIKGGAAQCWALDIKTDRLLSGNREPGFKAHMQAKDLHIVMDTAKEYGSPAPLTAVATQMFDSMLAYGWSEQDNSGVIGVVEKLANEELKTS